MIAMESKLMLPYVPPSKVKYQSLQRRLLRFLPLRCKRRCARSERVRSHLLVGMDC